MKNEIILYQPNDLTDHIEVRIDNEKETIWFTQKQMGKMNYNGAFESLRYQTNNGAFENLRHH